VETTPSKVYNLTTMRMNSTDSPEVYEHCPFMAGLALKPLDTHALRPYTICSRGYEVGMFSGSS
jgi:hypothetical protein